ncbi:MAG: hypothetical protein JWR38_2227 [Mucilaginibacter sp.]|jgi:translation elongation factor EF-Tu-like GTPase|nr:hypothetical protein [Mucilaginibacter sp.]
MKSTPDFNAKLRYLTKEAGGRSTPAFSGYRPQVKFAFSDMQTSGQQKFLDREIVYPGEEVLAEITIISTQPFEKKLYPGLCFDFREGPRIIGNGEIIEVLNADLKQ